MSPSELSKRLEAGDDLRLLDVRGEDEAAVASLPNARLLPLQELEARVAELEDWKADEVVIYCHHGIRSLHALGFLRHCGFENLHNLDGGIDRWSLEVDSSVSRY